MTSSLAKEEIQTQEASKFLFDVSFDKEGLHNNEKIYSRADLAKEKEASYREGAQASNTEHLAQISQKLSEMIALEESALGTLQKKIAEIVTHVTRKILPYSAEKGALDEVLGVVNEAFKEAPPLKNLTIFVNPEVVEPLKEKLEDLKKEESFQAETKVEGEETLGPLDCRVDWEGQGVERLTSKIWAQVDLAVERYGVSPPEKEDAREEGALEEDSEPQKENFAETKEEKKEEAHGG